MTYVSDNTFSLSQRAVIVYKIKNKIKTHHLLLALENVLSTLKNKQTIKVQIL